MGSNWKRYPFEDCMDAIIDYRGKTPKKTTFGIPLITAKIIKNGAIQPVTEFIAEDDYDSWMRRGIPMEGDVVLTTEAPLGEVAQLDKRKVALAQRVITLRGKTDFLDNTFLKYLLISNDVQHQLDGRGTGTTVKGIKQSELRKVELPIPEFNTQLSIAKILVDLDNKIYLNQQTNQTLEKMAQTLFKSWFVDFDPVFDNALAKADFNLENLPSAWPDALLQRATSRLQVLQDNPTLQAKLTQHHLAVTENNTASEQASQAENTHQHFPSEFELNDEPSIGINGWIPKGWGVIPVSKAIQVNPRTTLSKGTIAKFADMKSIPISGYMVDEIIEKAFSGGAKFKQYDVLLARITPCLQNGKTALVDFLVDDEVGFGSTEFIVLRENKHISYPFIACLAREENFKAHCMQSMVGSSGRQRVQNACFDDYNLVLPKEDNLLNRFSEWTTPNFEKMTLNKLESQSLTKLRDTLLPKLISGELQIPDLEAVNG